MKSILRGLNRPVSQVLAALFGVFIAFGTPLTKPAPAYAILGGGGCACGIIQGYHTDTRNGVCNCFDNSLREKLIGMGSARPMYESPAGPEELLNGGSFGSVTEYFEHVWWPRYIHTQKLIEESQLGAAAIDNAQRATMADAQTISDTAARQQDHEVNIMGEHIGAPENSCADISLITSQNYMREQVRVEKSRISKRLLDRMSGGGNAEGPPVNKGSDFAKKGVVEYMISNNMLPEYGNDGANKKLGASGGGQAANADPLAFQTAIADPEAAAILLELISGDIFQDIIRPDNMDDGLTIPLGAAIYDQESYKASVSMLQQPLAHRVAELTPLSGVESITYLRKAFQKAGYPASLANLVLGPGGTISKAAADWIVNELRMNDASYWAKKVPESQTNILRSMLTNMYQQTSMLHSINETLKNMHMTIATSGLIATDARKEKVDQRVNQLNRGR